MECSYLNTRPKDNRSRKKEKNVYSLVYAKNATKMTCGLKTKKRKNKNSLITWRLYLVWMFASDKFLSFCCEETEVQLEVCCSATRCQLGGEGVGKEG